jgi:hypothetical protein
MAWLLMVLLLAKLWPVVALYVGCCSEKFGSKGAIVVVYTRIDRLVGMPHLI